MITANVSALKKELQQCTHEELIEMCLRLSKFKKENKELLTYLLFEAHNEDFYVAAVKEQIDLQFNSVNTSSYYFIKKSVRKILASVKKHIRYSGQKETEIELLLYFLLKLKKLRPSYKNNTVLTNSFNTQVKLIQKKMLLLDEDLQYDYNLELKELF